MKSLMMSLVLLVSANAWADTSTPVVASEAAVDEASDSSVVADTTMREEWQNALLEALTD